MRRKNKRGKKMRSLDYPLLLRYARVSEYNGRIVEHFNALIRKYGGDKETIFENVSKTDKVESMNDVIFFEDPVTAQDLVKINISNETEFYSDSIDIPLTSVLPALNERRFVLK
jgi:hypothetical protein